MQAERCVPDVPAAGRRLRLLVDTDAANEIDDLYAVALALRAPDRFRLEGFVATHFSHKPGSTEESYALLLEELRLAGEAGVYPVKRGGDPMQYAGVPSESEGADFIIERALVGSPADPLWVVCLGAATNLAAAILKAPEIAPRVRYVFHARNEMNWPARTTQFNVANDVLAARTLLQIDVPLVWFDTGTALRIPFEETERRLAPLGALGTFLHEYRRKRPHFMSPDKGFYDVGDIAWLIDPGVCEEEVIPAPELRPHLEFDPKRPHGQMRRVFDIDPAGTWAIFFEKLEADVAAPA
ncbi:MAG: nucleoside hydrolase [Kiritimatiellae bacterium]|nr:nucleoside hydrolase [Kiritimatiellia bacterium]